uniref:2OG-FeII_Oxy_2 domain-containing protein n=1 Tax=Rhabditophanes sp. KR3021 TaxID=114890 RepID=A0AC35TZ27_9BILA
MEEGVKCGCKGVRYCKFCVDSDRIKKFQFEKDPFGDHEVFVYSPAHNKSFKSALKADASLEQIREERNHLDKMGESDLSDLKCLEIEGLLLQLDFVNGEEEKFLAERIDKKEWKLSQSGRRKQDYGPQVAFKHQKVKICRFIGMPDYADIILNKMQQISDEKLGHYQPFELCNLEYDEERLSSIDMHKDDMWIWGNRLISLNLLEGSIMSLEKEKQLVFVDMPRLSLLCMYNECRYQWSHAIFPKHIVGRRIALTMREPGEAFLEGGNMYEAYGKELIRIGNIRLSTA